MPCAINPPITWRVGWKLQTPIGILKLDLAFVTLDVFVKFNKCAITIFITKIVLHCKKKKKKKKKKHPYSIDISNMTVFSEVFECKFYKSELQ